MGIRKFITRALARIVTRSRPGGQVGQKRKFYSAKRYYRRDCGIEFKSAMEANVYRWLKTKKGIIIQYEPDIFYFQKGTSPLGVKAYVPDFKITDRKSTWYVEVKGVVDCYSVEKARLMAKQYPWIKIYYIYPKHYEKIRDLYASSTPNWE